MNDDRRDARDGRDAGERNTDGNWRDRGKYAGEGDGNGEQSGGRGETRSEESKAKSEKICQAGKKERDEGEEIGEESRGKGEEDGKAIEEKTAAIEKFKKKNARFRDARPGVFYSLTKIP